MVPVIAIQGFVCIYEKFHDLINGCTVHRLETNDKLTLDIIKEERDTGYQASSITNLDLPNAHLTDMLSPCNMALFFSPGSQSLEVET